MSDSKELRLRSIKILNGETTGNVKNGDTPHAVTVDKLEQEDAHTKINCSQHQDNCSSYCIPCLTSHNPLPENANIFQKIRHSFMLPLHGNIASYIQFSVVCLQIWIVLYTLTHTEALPGGNYFSLLLLFICCAVGGYVISFANLPPLLGMLVVGLLLRNVPGIKYVGENINATWSVALRKIVLTVILTRAGLGLDIMKLKKLSWAVLRLAFLPCAAEIITTGIVSHFLLGFPWVWSLMLGCIMGALSPAVTVPSLVSLQDRRYGVAKGIPTMLLAAGGLDNVLCVTGFSVFMGIIFSDGHLVVTIVKGPIGVCVGIIYGFIVGILLWYIPAKDCGNKVFYKYVILICAGLIAVFGSSEIGLSGAGPLGCLTTATVAAYKWRQRRQPGEPDEIANVMALTWLIVQHFLFGLIGAAVDVSKIQSSTAGLGIATLAIGLVVRSTLSFNVTMRTGFNIKERLFVTFTWLSKATVQAAIGGLALDKVLESDDPNPDDVNYATDILTISVLAIIICAPVGATLMAVLGPKFLVQGDEEEVELEVTKEKVDVDVLDSEETVEVVSEAEIMSADIKPMDTSPFMSELSLTLLDRSSKHSLEEEEPVLNEVKDTQTSGIDCGVDNPAFEDMSNEEIASENTNDMEKNSLETNNVKENSGSPIPLTSNGTTVAEDREPITSQNVTEVEDSGEKNDNDGKEGMYVTVLEVPGPCILSQK